MKKNLFYILSLSLLLLIFFTYRQFKHPSPASLDSNLPEINILVNNSTKNFLAAQKIVRLFKENGYIAHFTDATHFKSGKYNLYITDDLSNIPDVKDKNAINMIWISTVTDKTYSDKLRQFDVIIVKSMVSFNFLKAVNVRTAYIPKAINMKKNKVSSANGKIMYVGDNNGFSLSLYLAGHLNFSVDVYGKGFENFWPQDEIKSATVSPSSYKAYSLVLVDQNEIIIRDELLDDKIIEIIENGGVPLVRYNAGLYKIFGEALPMYLNNNEFEQYILTFKNSPRLLHGVRENLIRKAKDWNTDSQVKKIIELFEVMEKKRRIPYVEQ